MSAELSLSAVAQRLTRLVEALERSKGSDQAWAAALGAAADVFSVAAADPLLVPGLRQLSPAAKRHCKIAEIEALSPQVGAAVDIVMDIPLERLRGKVQKHGRGSRLVR